MITNTVLCLFAAISFLVARQPLKKGRLSPVKYCAALAVVLVSAFVFVGSLLSFVEAL